MEFRVIWEIEIEAEGPKETAQEARTIQLTPGMSATLFDVSAHVAGKMYRIDLEEEPDRLDRDELFAVRAGLRLLQCNPKAAPSIRELASMILIFPFSWMRTASSLGGDIVDGEDREGLQDCDRE